MSGFPIFIADVKTHSMYIIHKTRPGEIEQAAPPTTGPRRPCRQSSIEVMNGSKVPRMTQYRVCFNQGLTNQTTRPASFPRRRSGLRHSLASRPAPRTGGPASSRCGAWTRAALRDIRMALSAGARQAITIIGRVCRTFLCV